MKKCCCHIFLLLLFSYSTNAGNESDTIATAKAWIQKGKFKKAEKILAAFERTHSQDLNTLWLYGQTAYWAGHVKTFHAVYKKAMNRFPSNYYLKLDYALKLVESGDVEEATSILDSYKKYDPSNNSLRLAQARISYWQGDYTTALQLLKNGSLLEERMKEATALKNEIRVAQSPWLKINTEYLKDDQPMQVITPMVEGGMYINSFFKPTLSWSSSAFKTDSTSSSDQRMTVGNKANFFKSGMVIWTQVGIVQLPNKAKTGIGVLEITKTDFKYLQLSGQVALQPYLVTLSSLSNKIVPYHFAVSAGWNNLNSWNGKVIGSIDVFPHDKNDIYNLSAWLFTPPVRLNAIQFRIGYAYGYSTSKENRYVSKKNVAAIVSAYKTTTAIVGVYDPYFTPSNQQVNSALLSISYGSGRLFFGINGSIGFLGRTNEPYLFLDKNKNNELFVNQGYSRINFYPNKIDVYMLAQMNEKASLKASYTFSNNNFYTSHLIGLSLVIHFWNEQNKK